MTADSTSIDRLINRGTLRKSAGSGAATLEFDLLDLQAGGRVESLVGTILIAGAFHSAGHWEAAQGALIDLNRSGADSQLRSGSTSAGTGQLRLSNGILTVADAVTLAGSFQQNGGEIDGAGTLTLAGPFEWNGGTQRGSPEHQTIVAGGLSIASGIRTLSGRTMILDSDTLWTAGTWQINGGATIINEANRTLDVAGVFLDDTSTNSVETLVNRGRLRKSNSSGSATLEAMVENHGQVSIEGGAMQLSNGMTQFAGTTNLDGGNLSAGGLISLQGGLLRGIGQIQGNVLNAGQVQPGSPIGTTAHCR